MEETTTMMVRKVPKDLHRALKVIAAEEGKSMQEIVIRLMRLYVDLKKGNEKG